MGLFSFLATERRQKSKQAALETQWEKNSEYIHRIIDGHYHLASEISEEEKAMSKKSFDAWMRKEYESWQAVPRQTHQRRMEAIEENLPNNFMWKEWREGEVLEEVFLNAFTEPFPSTHDMPEWAVSTKVADLLILKDVSIRDSTNYRVKIRHHYVNHNMIKGIIQFDLYKLETYANN